MSPVSTAKATSSSSLLLPFLLSKHVGTGVGGIDGCGLGTGDGTVDGAKLGSADGAGVGASVSTVMLAMQTWLSTLLFKRCAFAAIDLESEPEATAVETVEVTLL